MANTRSDPPSRIERILVATDFSANAESALRRAIELARTIEARIVLVHAVEATPLSGLSLELQENIGRGLAAQQAEIAAAGVEVTCSYHVGKPWEVIAEAEREHGADLIVVGARGRTAYARILVGSTADRVVRIATAPVLTVHPEDEGHGLEIKRAVLAIDFSEESIEAARIAAGLLARIPGRERLVLVHAWQPMIEYGFGTGEYAMISEVDHTEEQARDAIEIVAAELGLADLDVAFVVRQGYPADVIEKEAGAPRADLIVMGTHGRSGLRHLMLGSVAERVLHHARCPVLTLSASGLSARRSRPAEGT